MVEQTFPHHGRYLADKLTSISIILYLHHKRAVLKGTFLVRSELSAAVIGAQSFQLRTRHNRFSLEYSYVFKWYTFLCSFFLYFGLERPGWPPEPPYRLRSVGGHSVACLEARGACLTALRHNQTAL